MNQLISIIVPIYNIEDYLPACVESILDQDYQVFEMILVNDGSTDGSGELCNKYLEQDPRVKVIHQENQGVSAARNTGIKNAKGEYLTFIDGDDLVHSQYLSRMYSCIINNPKSDIVVCGKRQFVSTLEEDIAFPPRPVQVWTKEQALDELFYQRIINAPFSKLFKSSLFREDSFPVGLKIGEDLIMNISVFSRAEQVSQISDPLYGYRNRPGSAVSSGSFSDRMMLISELLRFLDPQAKFPGLNESVPTRIFAEAIYGSLTLTDQRSGQNRTEWNELRKILRNYRQKVLLNRQARTFLRCFALACYFSPAIPRQVLKHRQKFSS